MTTDIVGVDVHASRLKQQRKQRLEWYEQTIERSGKEMLKAFREMRVDMLKPWLYSHETFEDYCKQRWNLTDRRLRQLTAAQNLKELMMSESPELEQPIKELKESHARVLSTVEPEKRAEVLKAAIEMPGNLEAAKIKKAKSIIEGEPPIIEVCEKCGRPL